MSTVIGIMSFFLAATVHAAIWNPVPPGDGLNWEDPSNWDTGSTPGFLGDSETSARIRNGDAVTVSSDVTQGSLTTIEAGGGSTLLFSAGSRIPNASLSIDNISTGGSSVRITGGDWMKSGGAQRPITIGRVLSPANANTTSQLLVSAGSYVNTNAGSGGRMVIGHTSNLNSASFAMTGGSWSQSSFVEWSGGITGNSLFDISGGAFVAGNAFVGSRDSSDGLESILQITGSGASLVQFNNIDLFSNSANASGFSSLRYVLGSSGVTELTALGELDLGAGANAGMLEIDGSAWDGASGLVGGALPLADYNTLSGGFRSVNLIGINGSLNLSFDLGGGSLGIALENASRPASAAVPEPTTLASGIILLVTCCQYWRVQRRRTIVSPE